jgi:flavin reductase (DIM6/NTAB) family NADH-FMN oxidoreductase RutF
MSIRLLVALLAIEQRQRRKALTVSLKEKAVSVLKNSAVRKAALALVAAVAAALGFSQFGCAGSSNLAPKVVQALGVFECQLAAAKRLVPHVVLAEEVVNAARAKNYEYAVKTLLELGMSEDDIMQVAEALDACKSPVADPALIDG